MLPCTVSSYGFRWVGLTRFKARFVKVDGR